MITAEYVRLKEEIQFLQRFRHFLRPGEERLLRALENLPLERIDRVRAVELFKAVKRISEELA